MGGDFSTQHWCIRVFTVCSLGGELDQSEALGISKVHVLMSASRGTQLPRYGRSFQCGRLARFLMAPFIYQGVRVLGTDL